MVNVLHSKKLRCYTVYRPERSKNIICSSINPEHCFLFSSSTHIQKILKLLTFLRSTNNISYARFTYRDSVTP